MNSKTSNEQQWKLLVLILKKIAESKGITHQKIADITGLHRSNVSRMFGLNYCPNMRTFVLISKAISVNLFFEDKDGLLDITKIFESAMGEY